MERSPKSTLAARPSFQRLAAAFVSYAAFYLALFWQFPAKGAVHGNCDTLIAIGLSNTYITKFLELLGLGSAGRAMFPASNVLAYGEAAPGMSSIYIFYRLLGFDDIFASYFFITSVFTLTAVGVYIFAGLFVRSFAARLFAGFAFTCSNMMFAHIDDSAVIFYLLPLLSLTFLIRFFRERDSRFLTTAAILGGAQVYFSVYVFVYQSVLLLFVAVIQQSRESSRALWGQFLKPAVIYTLIASPLLLFYLAALKNLDIVSPFEAGFVTKSMSWQVPDMFLALRNNILYGGLHQIPQEWHLVRHFNLIGFFVLATGIGALVLPGRHRVILGGIGVIGFMLAIGPVLLIPTSNLTPFAVTAQVPTPLYPLYEWIPLFSFHRIPVRAYFLVLLAVSVLSSVTLQWLLDVFKGERLSSLIIVGVLAVFHFVENVPMPMPAYAELGSRLQLPGEYETFLASARKGGLILDLPSRFGLEYGAWNPDDFQDIRKPDLASPLDVKQGNEIVGSSEDIFLYNRDALYLNWQTQHRRDIVNGANGYFPASRLVFDRWIEDLPEEKALRWLHSQGVDYLVYHKELELWGEHLLLEGLSRSPLLRQVFSGDEIIVFEFK